MKRKLNVLIVALLICLSSVLIIPDDLKVKANSGEGESENGEILLDKDFAWERTWDLCNVTYEAYEGDEIRKGRAFGTKGDNYAADLIYNWMSDGTYMVLEDVAKVPIDHIESKPEWNYTNKVELIDFQLEIDNPSYPYTNPIPKNETFIWSAAMPLQSLENNKLFPEGTLDLNNVEIVPGEVLDLWPFGGSFSGYYYNLSFSTVNGYGLVLGNVSFIANDEELPSNQDGMVFIMYEGEDCEDKLLNVSLGVSAVILIYNESRGYHADNATNCKASVVRVVNDEDNSENITAIIDDLVNNNTIFLADNVVKGGTITFTYELDSGLFWPSDEHIYIDEIPDPYVLNETKFPKDVPLLQGDENLTLPDYLGLCFFKTNYLWWLNYRPVHLNKRCKGFLLYTNESYGETHVMAYTMRDWIGYPSDLFQTIKKFLNFLSPLKVNTTAYIGPSLPIYSFNYTVGNWLEDHHDTPDYTISGFVEQKYRRYQNGTGVEAYNVVGNISVPDTDEIIVISNRYDGMWGETPGDSGCGAGICLGIAKYFKDNDITPKCNLAFLETTGEEYGYRGAYHYSHVHEEENIAHWIGFDQVGMNQSDLRQRLCFKDNDTIKIVWAITNDTNYEERAGYGINFTWVTGKSGGEDVAWRERTDPPCDTIIFSKDNDRRWLGWHKAGRNFSQGDVLENIDRNDFNITFEMAWNITKYFTVDPDCWFSNVTYEAFDSPDDGDTLDDSIRANFTINTVMPHDLNRMKVDLFQGYGGQGSQGFYENVDYIVKSPNSNYSYTFTIPDGDATGNYSLKFTLYNSTGRINEIVEIGEDNYNDSTSWSDVFQLYHPFGYTKVGATSQSVEDKITGSVFTANEYGTADNITRVHPESEFISNPPGSPRMKCMIFRVNDSKLIGTTEEKVGGASTFNFSDPKPVLIKDTEYILTVWGNNSNARVYYDDFEDERGRHYNLTYNNTWFTIPWVNESRLYSIYCSYTADTTPPEITNVTDSPDTVGFGFNVAINADVTDNESGVSTVKVNVTYPDDTSEEFPMNHTTGDTYEYVFTDTWLVGQYNYTIWAVDRANNSNTSLQCSFNVSAQCNVSIQTLKDEYGSNEYVNLTDPPEDDGGDNEEQQIGYELLDDNTVLHIWNRHNDYYFNTSSGIQLTNHYNEYWSHNVLMLGYYNNEEWNLIYRTDELSGFNKNIDSDNETYINATLWKDLSYGDYNFKLAIRYHLGVNDSDLTIIPYIKNLGQAIPYDLAFGWELKDIKIDNTYENDWIRINRTSYPLNQTLDIKYTNITKTVYEYNETTNETTNYTVKDGTFHLENITTGTTSNKNLYLKWNSSLDYLVWVKSRSGQYNAPVTLFIKVGTLGVGQEKFTELYWLDAEHWSENFDSYAPGSSMHGQGGWEGWENDSNYTAYVTGDWCNSGSSPHSVDITGNADLVHPFTGVNVGEQIFKCEVFIPSGFSGVSYFILLNTYGVGIHSWSTQLAFDSVAGVIRSEYENEVLALIYDEGVELRIEIDFALDWQKIYYDGELLSEKSWTDGVSVDGSLNLGAVDLFANDASSIYYDDFFLEGDVAGPPPNNAPTQTGESPTNGDTGISTTPSLHVICNDDDSGDTLTATWRSNSSGEGWVTFATSYGISPGTNITKTNSNFNAYNTTYYWKVSLTDGTDWCHKIYHFTTYIQSKINNTGSTDISGYLLIQVQYNNSGEWVVDNDTVNETTPRTINISEQLALDTIFNGLVNTNDLSNGDGTYRVYAAFRDPYGNVLVCDDATKLEAWYEFEVDTS